ncbi:hypothetical protein C4571_00585 [Candidatus Parcubacteria bacterium]|nr:MAG: hypothetical protein C4571_00585 [Candidatus Parcubacteria bacterium]
MKRLLSFALSLVLILVPASTATAFKAEYSRDFDAPEEPEFLSSSSRTRSAAAVPSKKHPKFVQETLRLMAFGVNGENDGPGHAAAWAWGTCTYRITESRSKPCTWVAYTNSEGLLQLELDIQIFRFDRSEIEKVLDSRGRSWKISVSYPTRTPESSTILRGGPIGWGIPIRQLQKPVTTVIEASNDWLRNDGPYRHLATTVNYEATSEGVLPTVLGTKKEVVFDRGRALRDTVQ